MAHNDAKWTEKLPLVLLGIRTAVKTDIGCSVAELVYGTTLRLPGQCITKHEQTTTDIDPSDYVHRLRKFMQDMHPPPSRTQHKPTFIHNDLSTFSHVFVRDDTVRKPLQHPYRGPFPVIRRADKFFVIDYHGKHDTVSIDRLKPAFIETDIIPEPLPRTTRPPVTTNTQRTTQPATPPSIPPRTPTSHSNQPTTEIKKTRSSRHVQFPTKYVDYCDNG
ncbi:uncharacterized protein [Diadema setosum]|uniref:uncharacterized protein n=1 Tax=Diadema setosum TaxID=31175 RepID=UPI003B3AA47E